MKAIAITREYFNEPVTMASITASVNTPMVFSDYTSRKNKDKEHNENNASHLEEAIQELPAQQTFSVSTNRSETCINPPSF